MVRWKLTDREWAALDALRSSTVAVAVFRNATVILMSGVGRSKASIATELGCCPATVDNSHRPPLASHSGVSSGAPPRSANTEELSCQDEMEIHRQPARTRRGANRRKFPRPGRTRSQSCTAA